MKLYKKYEMNMEYEKKLKNKKCEITYEIKMKYFIIKNISKYFI